ncbi:MAG TPA: hypothetical protein PKE45_17835 [Caldilineaceae bacterium]|nr:hypothetical protein [Caldilineaceae bacterium]
MNEIVTREEQEHRGLLPQRRPSNFVSMPQAAHPVRFDPHQVELAVNHPATQHVELRTSAVDRAKGFQWMITPISIVVAVLAVIVSLAFDNEFLSFWSLLIFWLTFCVVYVAGWAFTALMTPEFISLYSARRQWDVIDREQERRWQHYEQQTAQADAPVIDVTKLHKSFTVTVSSVELPGWMLFVAGLVGVICGVAYLVGG